MGGRLGDCPVSKEKSERLIRLPFFNHLRQDDQIKVIQAVQEFHV
jgi:dTDP-4-amino-4,6-dideoxygalactose transaminase